MSQRTRIPRQPNPRPAVPSRPAANATSRRQQQALAAARVRARNRRWVAVGAISTFAVVAAILFAVLHGGGGTGTGSSTYPYQVGQPGPGAVAPEFKLASTAGGSFDLAAQKVSDEGITSPVLSDPNLSVSSLHQANQYGMMGTSADGHTFIVVGPDGHIRWRADYGGAPNYTMDVPMSTLIQQMHTGLHI
jgi:hypothetical protein